MFILDNSEQPGKELIEILVFLRVICFFIFVTIKESLLNIFNSFFYLIVSDYYLETCKFISCFLLFSTDPICIDKLRFFNSFIKFWFSKSSSDSVPSFYWSYFLFYIFWQIIFGKLKLFWLTYLNFVGLFSTKLLFIKSIYLFYEDFL